MAKSAAGKMADYRRRQRERGRRQMQRWVPDVTDPRIRNQLSDAANLLQTHPSTREGDTFIEAALADLDGESDRKEGR